MATDTYHSKFARKDRGVTSRTRRVFEGNEERTTVVTSVSTSGIAGKYKSTGDRGDKTDSMTSRLSNVSVNDDVKNDSENEEGTTQKNDDVEEPQHNRRANKKLPSGGSSANKRKNRKNLREKRRSTGVVIMPDQPNVAGDDDEQVVNDNTARNMDASLASQASGSSTSDEDIKQQFEQYEIAIEEWKDELAKAKKEIESLQRDNLRLKDENSALLRVVQKLSRP